MPVPISNGDVKKLPRHIWLISLGISTLLAVALALQTMAARKADGSPVLWDYLLISGLVSFWIYGALAPLVVWFSWRFPIEKKKRIRRILLHVAASLIFTAVHSAVRPLIYKMSPSPAAHAGLSWPLFHSMFLFLLFDNTVNTYWPLVAMSHMMLYYRNLREREVRQARLETQLTQAQLSMLRMQLQPHFLFNTLNAVSALVRENPRAAEEMLEKLSELLRLTLDHQGTQEVSLKSELDFIGSYLMLEQIRFADRLQVTITAAPETLDAAVPSMALQPLIENSLRHGIARRARGGQVHIRAWREADQLCLEVEDNGSGLLASPALLGGNGVAGKEGVGLTNTRARLKQLYGEEESSFELHSVSGGGAIATMRVPFHVVESEPTAEDHWFSDLAPAEKARSLA